MTFSQTEIQMATSKNKNKCATRMDVGDLCSALVDILFFPTGNIKGKNLTVLGATEDEMVRWHH